MGEIAKERVLIAAQASPELHSRLREHAAAHGRSLASELRRAAAVYLKLPDDDAQRLLEGDGRGLG